MRRLITALSILSLAVCVIVAGLWTVSRFTAMDLHDYRQTDEISVTLERDRVQFGWVEDPEPAGERGTPLGWVFTRLGDTSPADWRHLGFGYESSVDADGTRGRVWVVPFWPLVVLTLVLPGVVVTRRVILRHRAARAAAGRCPQCNYNLTGNTSGVCPECGTPTAGVKA